MEFADAKRQAEWQRIATAAQESYRKINGAKSEVPGLVAAPQTSTGKTLMLALVGCAVIATAGVVAYKVMQSKSKAGLLPAPTTTHISIFRTQPGARCSGGSGYPPATVGANGEASVEVKPGTYKFSVTKQNFEPYNEQDVKVDLANPDREPVVLTKSGTTGTLVVQGTTPAKVKVFVDGALKGTVGNGGQIKLEAGPHKVHFSALPDYLSTLPIRQLRSH